MLPCLSYGGDRYGEEKRMKIIPLLRLWSTVAPLSILVIFTAMLGACEYPGVPHPLADKQSQGAPPTLSQVVPEPPASPSEEPPSKSVIQEGLVEIALKDFFLEPDQITVKAGRVTFILVNKGRYTHDLRVQGQGVNEKAPRVAVGREFQWELDLKPGEYRIDCPISNHDERGMIGTLIVVE